MAALTEPWSKRHKAVTRNDREGLQYNLSNSFAQPTSQAELERHARERGDDELIAAYRESFAEKAGVDVRLVKVVVGKGLGINNIAVTVSVDLGIGMAKMDAAAKEKLEKASQIQRQKNILESQLLKSQLEVEIDEKKDMRDTQKKLQEKHIEIQVYYRQVQGGQA